MMNLDRRYILGYLQKLGHDPVLLQLSDEDTETARMYVTASCAAYLMHYMESGSNWTTYRRYVEIIKYTEALKSFLLWSDPQYQQAMKDCSKLLLDLLKKEDVLVKEQNEFLDKFDMEIENINSNFMDKTFKKDFKLRVGGFGRESNGRPACG